MQVKYDILHLRIISWSFRKFRQNPLLDIIHSMAILCTHRYYLINIREFLVPLQEMWCILDDKISYHHNFKITYCKHGSTIQEGKKLLKRLC